MDSREFDFGKESKDFIEKENKKLRNCIDKLSKYNYKIAIIVAVISIISAVIGAAVGAWIQSGGINPPPESNVDILFHDINKNKAIPDTHQVKFSDEAWKLAHQFRRERGERHVETINAKTKEIKNNT